MLLVGLVFPSPGWGVPNQDPSVVDPRVADPRVVDSSVIPNFRLEGQNWNAPDNTPSEVLDEDFCTLQKGGERKLYQVLAKGTEGLTLVDLSTQHRHLIPITANTVSVSKNYLFIPQGRARNTATDAGNPSSGFYVIRLIDLYHLGFHSPIPLYFIPTDISLGHITEVTIEHNHLEEESRLYLTTDSKTHSILEMEFGDVEDLIKAQLIALSMYQAMHHPDFEDLNILISQFKDRITLFYTDLHEELKSMGEDKIAALIFERLKTLDWQSSSAEELENALEEVHQNPQMETLKQIYAERLSQIIADFYTQYDEIMDRVKPSFVLPASVSATPIISQEEKNLEGWSSLEGDQQRAFVSYAAIVLGITFVTLVLPKILKKPFSTIAADYSLWHYNLLTKSRIRQLAYRFFPNYLETSNSRLAAFINGLGETETRYQSLKTTGDHFRRAFWQVSGDTASVVISELVTRPFLRSPEEEGARNAILLTEPFSDTHSLYLQKNFVYRVVGNQVLGSIMTTVGIAILEKEYDEILQKFIFDTNMEQAISEQLKPHSGKTPAPFQFNFSERERRQIAKMMNDDLRFLRETIEQKTLRLISEGHPHPSLPQLGLQATMTELRSQWISNIEKMFMRERGIAFQFEREFREKLVRSLDEKLTITSSAAVEKYLADRANVGVIQKCWRAFTTIFERALGRLIGKEAATHVRYWSAKSWNLWSSINKTYFYNSMAMQTLTRGSANPTLFGFARIVSLFVTTPIYVTTYTYAKRRFGLRTGRGEFLYGFFYGIVTNTISNFLFVQLYEKRIMGTWLDIETSHPDHN